MFCKFCGKELQDGEVCGCAGSQQAAAAQAQQTSGAAQAATDQMSSHGSGRKCMEESAWHL